MTGIGIFMAVFATLSLLVLVRDRITEPTDDSDRFDPSR